MQHQTTDRFPIEKPKDYKFYEYKLVGGDVVELKRIVACSFEIEDSQNLRNTEAGKLLFKWTQSDRGQWIMENAFELPYFEYYKRADRWTVEFKVVATFEAKKLTEYYLRWA